MMLAVADVCGSISTAGTGFSGMLFLVLEKGCFFEFSAGKRLYFSFRQQGPDMITRRLYLKLGRILLLFLALVLLTACGQKGDLYLPDQHAAAQAGHASYHNQLRLIA